MFETILNQFPAGVYALILVFDPDQILADETILTTLAGRGFQLISCRDPIQLQLELSITGSFSVDAPLIITAQKPLAELPYALWQPGHRISLALNAFFPTLSYPVLQTLTLNQRRQLSEQTLPRQRLGRQGTMEFLLRCLFAVDWPGQANPGGLFQWLSHYHQSESMPGFLTVFWEQRVRRSNAIYENWPLAAWLKDPQVFQSFLSEEWSGYVALNSGQKISEPRTDYQLNFDQDSDLQRVLPALIQTGTITPVTLANTASLPRWAKIGTRTSPADFANQRFAGLLQQLHPHLAAADEARWSSWQAIAPIWAEMTTLFYHPDQYLTAEHQAAFIPLQDRLDNQFAGWLQKSYAPLATQSLPQPHHLFHIPQFMAYQRRLEGIGRMALIVLDGLSLAMWQLLAEAWRQQELSWRWQTRLLLAEIPTLTAISRQALISGKRPANFAATLSHNRQESQQWITFWEGQDLAGISCAYDFLRLGSENVELDGLYRGWVQALCLINNSIDEMVHGASQGMAGLLATFQTWLKGQEWERLNYVIKELLASNYTVYLTSDHGHTEAVGMGQPSEGLTVQTRSKRARIYDDLPAAQAVQNDYPETHLWASRRVLPENTWVLMPKTVKGRRQAFAQPGKKAVTHGGISIDEMIVPLVKLTKN